MCDKRLFEVQLPFVCLLVGGRLVGRRLDGWPVEHLLRIVHTYINVKEYYESILLFIICLVSAGRRKGGGRASSG